MRTSEEELRGAVKLVAALNLGYFGVEFAAANWTGSVSLFADSVDFLEDAAVNFLIFAAMAWGARRRAKTGMALAGILLVPAAAFLWTLWRKFSDPTPPQALLLGVTGAGALMVNLFCAFRLARWRNSGGSLSEAAFLSARNDAIANVAIMAAGMTTHVWPTIWPDVVVGLAIAAMNIDAARVVWSAARAEHLAVRPRP